MKQPLTINKALEILELDPNLLNVIHQEKTFETATLRLKEIKKIIKKQRSKLAKRYHPDVNPVGAEKMKLINFIVDELFKLKLKQRRPMYRNMYVRVNPGYSDASTYTDYTASTASTTKWW